MGLTLKIHIIKYFHFVHLTININGKQMIVKYVVINYVLYAFSEDKLIGDLVYDMFIIT